MGSECHLGFISLHNAYKVVCMFQIDFHIYPGGSWSIEQICDEREQITVLLHDFVECMEIDAVGGIIVQYPAHLCSPFLTLTAIPIFPFYILYPASTKNAREPPLNSNSTHIHFHIPLSKSIPNPNAIMPSIRAGFYDHNGGTFNSVPILEGEIRHLPDLCLHAFLGNPFEL